MATPLVISTSNIGTCIDVAECGCVENVITVLSHYYCWNIEELSKDTEYINKTIDYSSLNNILSPSQSGTNPKSQLTKSVLTKNQSIKYDNIISQFMDNASYNLISLIDDFNHILLKHCNDDREFEWIYLELIEENEIKSPINKLNNILHRHNYSRDIVYKNIELMKKLYYGYYETKDIIQFQVLDKIYCHFIHCYDFGFRLKPNELLEISNMEETQNDIELKSDKDPEINIDRTLGRIAEKLTFLRMNLVKFDTLKDRFNNKNRFVTNYDNTAVLSVDNVDIQINLDDNDNDNDDNKQDINNNDYEPSSSLSKPKLVLNNTQSGSKSKSKTKTKKLKLKKKKSKDHNSKIIDNAASLQQIATIQGKSNEAIERDAYMIGRRWHYSSNTEGNQNEDVVNGGVSGDWYIATKYLNIKREMLDNNIYSLSMNQWIFNYDYAITIMKTEKAKSTTKQTNDRYKTFYDDNQLFKDLPQPNVDDNNDDDINDQNQMFSKPISNNNNTQDHHTITINHILAVLFYCNFDELSRSFRSTYQRNDLNETVANWKLRHSEFANLGRLIRDVVEDFGELINESSLQKGDAVYFYHGIDGNRLVFNTTMMRFSAPISTSLYHQIIQMYTSGGSQDGLIIECKEYSKYLRYFNSFWLTSHSNEYERIFCGGDWPIKMNAILDIGISCYNYRYYLKAINIIQDLIRGEYNHECKYIDFRIKYAFNRIISSRLWMKDAIPKYIQDMFDSYCNNLGEMIEINCEYLNMEEEGYLNIKSSIIDDQQNDKIKFDVLCGVFPNVTIFKFLTYKLNLNTFDYLYELISTNKHKDIYESKLKYVIFSAPNEVNLKCKNIIKLYKTKFKKYNWVIEYKKKDQFGQPVLIITDHKLKMDDCLIM